ncbi:hypothetical protein PVMG_06064 [Plasmodium vivax Mauritania I]|uniref:Variable surface protein Vir4 n=1 Tax=Plasmodium vivax Mauritania I TaxID=1035515 RepID=A0A0J9T462_PLAVI|nr:hypothetical protein PVMG_06064 [Plasmodium vivax Mauritania I]
MLGIKNTEWNERDALEFSIDQKLSTGIFYDQLDTSNTSTLYDEYCGTSESPIHKSRPLRNTCATILEYLETKYSPSEHTHDAYDVCKLLNYWVFNRLSEICVTNDTPTPKDAFKTLEEKWKKFINDNESKLNIKECKPDPNLFNYDDWKQRKELYDYYVDISPISMYLRNYTQDCDQYYKYIKYKKKIYDNFAKLCLNPKDSKCPSIFNNCQKHNPKDILPTLPCYSNRLEEEKATQDQASRAPAPLHTLANGGIPDSTASIGTKASNAFLGVVATSMTSGALYKVKKNFISTYKICNLINNLYISYL